MTKSQALKQYLYAKYNFENPLPENWQSVCDELANALNRTIEANVALTDDFKSVSDEIKDILRRIDISLYKIPSESAVGFLEELWDEIESKIDSFD